MNPNLELESIIAETVVDWRGNDDDGLSAVIYNEIRNWMDRNQIIFYQP